LQVGKARRPFIARRAAATPRPRIGCATHRRGPGVGKRYRLTLPGPGVTPDISWEGPGLHAYDPKNPRTSGETPIWCAENYRSTVSVPADAVARSEVFP
jgi:hypothetical protein